MMVPEIPAISKGVPELARMPLKKPIAVRTTSAYRDELLNRLEQTDMIV